MKSKRILQTFTHKTRKLKCLNMTAADWAGSSPLIRDLFQQSLRQSISVVPIPPPPGNSRAIAHVFNLDVGQFNFYYLSGAGDLSISGALPFDILIVLVFHVVESADIILFSYLFIYSFIQLTPYDKWILKLPFVKIFNLDFFCHWYIILPWLSFPWHVHCMLTLHTGRTEHAKTKGLID